MTRKMAENLNFSLFKQIIDNTQDVIIITKADNIDYPGPEIIYVNNAFFDLTGYTKEEAIGESPRLLQSPDTDNVTKKKIRDALIKKEPIRVTIKNYTKSGQSYWLDLSIQPLYDETGKVTHFAAIERDITSQKNREIQFENDSKTDSLTGLCNRRAFDQVLFNEIERYKRTSVIFSIISFDIDHFKAINDKYGHETGDNVLKKIGSVCKSFIRVNDTAARIGGEEFCILLSDTNEKDALLMAERLRHEIEHTEFLTLDKKKLTVTGSFGITEIKNQDDTASAIMRRADTALYESKGAGRNCSNTFQ